jgi:type I restriction enzyme M protein
MTSNGIVQKLWNYCNLLRDDGLSYGDYVEQLTFLLFLKMADEQTKAPYNKPAIIPKDLNWNSLKDLDGEELDRQYQLPPARKDLAQDSRPRCHRGARQCPV